MTFVRKITAASAVVAVLGVAACGGNSGSTENGKFVRGAISAFGSVYVNGSRYNTDNASVYIDDEKGDESDLRVGMMVTMAESSPGVVSSIYYDDDVEGVVTANDLGSAGNLVVMGQIIAVTDTIVFEDKKTGATTPAEIAVGSVVEVTGSPSGDGSFSATRIEVKAASLQAYIDSGKHLEVKGIVSAHDQSSSFRIGGLTVQYTGSTDTHDMPAGNWDGMYVEAKSNNINVDTLTMVASKVEREDDHMDGDENDEVEVKGKISALSDSSVMVNGVEFLRNANTEYELKGKTLEIGLLVEVEGHFNGSGQLVAKEIEVEDEHEANEVYGVVQDITRTDTNAGTVTVGGVVYTITASTIMHDDSHAVNNFNLSMLEVGNTVEIHVDANNSAIKLERK